MVANLQNFLRQQQHLVGLCCLTALCVPCAYCCARVPDRHRLDALAQAIVLTRFEVVRRAFADCVAQ
eukprot:7150345-Lingulodinium_polyedra.AAC.1